MVMLYRQGRLAHGDINLSEGVKKKVEDIFLGGGIPGKLLERISPPHTFPVDTAGKDRDSLPSLSFREAEVQVLPVQRS